MSEELKSKADTLFYALTKMAARNSFEDFLEDEGLTLEDYKEIKQEVLSGRGIKTYL